MLTVEFGRHGSGEHLAVLSNGKVIASIYVTADGEVHEDSWFRTEGHRDTPKLGWLKWLWLRLFPYWHEPEPTFSDPI